MVVVRVQPTLSFLGYTFTGTQTNRTSSSSHHVGLPRKEGRRSGTSTHLIPDVEISIHTYIDRCEVGMDSGQIFLWGDVPIWKAYRATSDELDTAPELGGWGK